MYVHVHMCDMCVRMCMYEHVCMSAYSHVCMYMCEHVCTSAYSYVCMCMHEHVYTSAYSRMCMCMCEHVCTSTYSYVYMCMYEYVCSCAWRTWAEVSVNHTSPFREKPPYHLPQLFCQRIHHQTGSPPHTSLLPALRCRRPSHSFTFPYTGGRTQ